MAQIARIGALVLAIACLWSREPVVSAQTRPPNIVLLVADDMGYGDIGVHGSKDIPTPNIDALARGGVRFTDGYVTGPYCSPTRAGLLTGRYQQRFGHEFNLGVGGQFGLPLSESTLADRLRAAGYRTALFGKWHLGAGEKFHPMSRGFDEFFGFLGGGHSYLDVAAESNNPLLDGRKPATSVTYLTDTLADRAVDFIRREKARPFLLYLAFNAVHTPMHATDKYLARFTQIQDSQRRTYAAMLSAMDDAIGRTIAEIRDQQLEENTLIVFISDNGGPTMMGTSVNASSNGPLRGSKRQTWEGGIRVPFIVRWKGHVPEGKTDARPVIQLDVLPTALAFHLEVNRTWTVSTCCRSSPARIRGCRTRRSIGGWAA
jgi:arylsulfatase A-like enzyme